MPPLDATASPLDTASGLTARARAFGKAVLFLLIAFVAAIAISAILKAATGQTLQDLMQAGPVDALIAHAGLLVALVIVPSLVSLLVWKEPFAFSGWSGVRAGALAALGVATGASFMVLIVLALWAMGVWSGALTPLSPAQFGALLLPSVCLWIVQAAHEEGLHRGYAFVQLSRAFSFWSAAALLSLWFVVGHMGQAGATPTSLAVAGLFALVLAWSFRRTGSLWFALGFHASWNFVQSTIFGLSNSGGESRHAVLQSQLTGPEFLTGGGAGPEGSLFSLAAVVGLILIVRFVLPHQKTRP